MHDFEQYREYVSSFTTRNDHEPGFIYIIEASGYHGIIPGCLLRRYKIGLARNMDSRLGGLESSQPPCPFRIIKAIYVQDMASVESLMHKRFAACRRKIKGKFKSSTEWFDFMPWDLFAACWALEGYKHNPRYGVASRGIPLGAIALGIVLLLAIVSLLQTALQPTTQSPAQTKQTIIHKKNGGIK